jgi:hypothetical protein
MEKEGQHFFLPIMGYLKGCYAKCGTVFDRMIIYTIYEDYIEKTKEDLRDTFTNKWVRSSLML